MKSFHDGRVVLHAGDCLERLAELPDCSIDSVVTDPPYHLTSIVKRFGGANAAPAKDCSGEREGATGAYARASRGFMGKTWDGGDIAFRVELWAQVLRVLKPGGHLLAFSGTRTYHRMAVTIEDAGFEIRDCKGFAHDDSPAYAAFLQSLGPEQAAAFARLFGEQGAGMLAWAYGSGFPKSLDVSKAIDKAAGAKREKIAFGNPVRRMIPGADQDTTGSWVKDNGREYQPGFEIPATDEAREWEGWGTAVKPAWEPICVARKPLSEGTVAANVLAHGTGAINIDACRVGSAMRSRSTREKISENVSMAGGNYAREIVGEVEGRFPANIIHDGSSEVLAAFPETAPTAIGKPRGAAPGSAARFFYSAKADGEDRLGSKHPTVKPVDLMRWLVRLVTPPGGVVLDPFAGTGTTGEAAFLEGFSAVLIEREEEYRADIARRMGLMLASQRERRVAAQKAAPAGAGPLFDDLVRGGGGFATAARAGRTIGPIGLKR